MADRPGSRKSLLEFLEALDPLEEEFPTIEELPYDEVDLWPSLEEETMEASAEGFAHPEYLVESDWLGAHLGDPDVVVLDCTAHLIPDPKITYMVKSGREDFEKGHIPGAQFLDLQADLSDTEQLPLRFMLPKAVDFAAAMRRFGISDKTRMVTYSTANAQWATRVWWVLRVYGFENATVLNGGFQKWSREDRAVETGAGKGRKPGSFTERPARPLMVGKDEVLAAIGDGASCTI